MSDINGNRHCDDFIDDPSAPDALRHFLSWARLPAACKYWGPAEDPKWIPKEMRPHIWRGPIPRLFADYEGERVQVTVASRFGDVGINRDLSENAKSYFVRVSVEELSNFSDAPDPSPRSQGGGE